MDIFWTKLALVRVTVCGQLQFFLLLFLVFLISYFVHRIYSQVFTLLFNALERLSQTSENLIAELFSTVSFATSITSEGSAPVFPNSMLLLLLLSRMRSSGPMVEAGTAGTGSGMKTSETSGASGNGRGWTAGFWGRTDGGEGDRTLVPQVFFGTALLTLIGTRLCSLWQA